jgi:hypothetical protein
VLRIPLATSDIESGIAGRVILVSRQLRNLHWLAAEINAGMNAQLAESLASRESLLNLEIEEVGGSGGRFRQRRLWRGTKNTFLLVDEAIERLRPELDEAVMDLFVSSDGPTATI